MPLVTLWFLCSPHKTSWNCCLYSLFPIPFLVIFTELILICLHLSPERLFSKLPITFTLLDVLVKFQCSPDLTQQHRADLVGLFCFLTCIIWTQHFPGFLSYLTQSLMTSMGWGLFPCGGSNLGTLLFSIFSLHSLSWLAHPVSQMTPKFISSPDTAPELQTHIFNCLLVTLLGCLITTSWTALTNVLLPQPYPSQLMPFILLLRQKPQSWPELFSFSSLVHLMSE